MGVTADSVVVTLIAANDEYDARVKTSARVWDTSMKRMEVSATRMESKTTGAFNAVSSSLKAAAAGLVAGLGVEVIVRAASKALDYAASLGEVSQQLGVTARDLQVYRYAATQAGLSQDELDEGLGKLTKSIGEAALGSERDKKVFQALGISITDATGRVRTAGDVIPELADALKQVTDPAKRAALEIQIFGRAGQKLDTLLAGGSDAINQLRKEAEKLGIILSDRQIQQADQTADKIAKLKFQLQQNIAGVVANNAGAILTLANALAALVGQTISAVSWLGKLATLEIKVPGFDRASGRQAALQGRERQLQGINAARMLNMSGGAAPVGKQTVNSAAIDSLLATERNAAKRSARAALDEAAKAYDEFVEFFKSAGSLAHEFQDIRSIDPSEGFGRSYRDITGVGGRSASDVASEIDERKDREYEANQLIADDLSEKMHNRIQTIADFYESAMLGGTDNIVDTLKRGLIHAIAQALASQTAGGGGNFFSTFATSLGSVFGFAQGGSGIIGGRPGTDRNTLSLNGKPFAKVSQGEKLTISPTGRAARGGGGTTVYQTIQVDGRNSVTPAGFASQIVRIAAAQAAQMDAANLRAASKAAPGRMQQFAKYEG